MSIKSISTIMAITWSITTNPDQHCSFGKCLKLPPSHVSGIYNYTKSIPSICVSMECIGLLSWPMSMVLISQSGIPQVPSNSLSVWRQSIREWTIMWSVLLLNKISLNIGSTPFGRCNVRSSNTQRHPQSEQHYCHSTHWWPKYSNYYY